MNRFELAKLSRKINYLLDMNGGCTDDYIKELMHTYKLEMNKLKRGAA